MCIAKLYYQQKKLQVSIQGRMYTENALLSQNSHYLPWDTNAHQSTKS